MDPSPGKGTYLDAEGKSVASCSRVTLSGASHCHWLYGETVQEELALILLKLFHKTQEEDRLPSSFTRPALFQF